MNDQKGQFLRDRRIAIAGGGVAGLACAAALLTQGAGAVELFEQAPEITEVGAGLQISPNGVAVLDALGLGAAARDLGTHIRATRLVDGVTGRVVTEIDQGGRARPYLALHRADLIDMLAGRARDLGARLHLGRRLPPEEETTADLRIGADGLHSAFRAWLLGPQEPFFTHQVAWRALVPAPRGSEPVATVHMGPHCHMVSYPLRGGQLMNIVAVEERADWTPEGWSYAADPDEMRARFAVLRGAAGALLEAVTEVRLWGLFRHPVARRWQDGRGVAIIGDAAHPTLPFLAQGANMALEDAWVLAAEAAAAPLADALAAFEARRRPRAERAVAAANANARNFHHAGPLARALGHGALGLAGRFAPGLLRGRFDWLYDVDVTAGARAV